MSRALSLTRVLALSLLALLPLGAQVIGGACPQIRDDGFNIGCCSLVQATNIPNFGGVSLTSEYACIRDCDLERVFRVQVRLSYNPTALCDLATIRAAVIPLGSNGPSLSGTLFAKYSRTFVRVNAAGVTEQVWRFLVNGDMRYDTTVSGPRPCPTPPDAAQTTSHYVGSIDYSCDTATPNRFTARFDLSHLPGCISHAPFSTTPLTGPLSHQDRSYHIVGPGPFNWASSGAADGRMNGEAIRPTRASASPFNWFCLGENSVPRGEIRSLSRTCPCPSVGTVGNMPWIEQEMRGTAVCNGNSASFSTLPIPGFSGAGGLLALPLGTYRDGTRLATYFGVMRYTDPCTGDGPIHVVHGSATSYPGGFRSFHNLPVAQLNRTALDLGNSLPLQSGLLNLGWGSAHLSTLAFQFNL